MAGIMVVAAIVGLIGLRPGVQEEAADELELVADSIAESESGTTAPLTEGPIVGPGVDEHGGAGV